ncbi:hypothetical protein C2R22_11545 [Salinigranum rubrum]|uniref:DUF2064 domain-containing protein n=1 Tax=Salinigranum rubrum TaxID=755307 RepID=A0A2I8VJU3_9EURY|nr:hypothetical protein [Salinigranum rubrum]AUV82203.1 hypothetical protein C2R22_11545 [Salinigranum rubrum]
MTVVCVLCDPPRPGLVLSDLVENGPLTGEEAADLYAAMLKDTFVAVERSGGDLLVNYRPEEHLPEEHRRDEGDAEAAVRALAADALSDLDDVRFEVQVGSSYAARAGNTATHLLREEDADSVAVVRGTAPFLTRATVDSAAMKLRSTPVVLGPAPEGRVFYAAFTEPIDFADAFAAPEVSTLAARGDEADLGVDFLPMQPVLRTPADFDTVLPLLAARRDAGRIVPRETAPLIAELGLLD